MLKNTFISLFYVFLALGVFAQNGKEDLNKGIVLFQDKSYQEAVIQFQTILKNTDYTQYYPDAFFWMAKTYLALNMYPEAEKILEHYLVNYRDNKNYEEGMYLKGRLLFLQGDYQSTVQVYQKFIETYPKSVFIPYSWFWIGESLFLLGDLEASKVVFQSLINEYPDSAKVEAAKYRISLIDIKKREVELLKLLKLSHEEYLKTLEELQKKIKTYELAIAAYQKDLSGKGVSKDEIKELENIISERDKEIQVLKEEVEKLKKQIALLEKKSGEIATTPDDKTVTTTVDKTNINETDEQKKQRLLKAKQDAENLKKELEKKLE